MKSDTIYKIVVSGLIVLLVSSLIVGFVSDDKDPELPIDPITVGVVDSGCAENQNSFVLDYKNFAITEYGFPVDDPSAFDSIGHGTNICKIINEQAPNVGLVSAKIASFEGILTFEAIIGAIDWLVKEKQVDIINLSLSSDAISIDVLEQSFKEYSDTVIIVASTGNRGSTAYNTKGNGEWPSNYPWIIGVGAIDNNDPNRNAEYSLEGRTIYGPHVVEFVDNGNDESGFGTSISTPRITGKLAKILDIAREEGIRIEPREANALLAMQTERWQQNEYLASIGWGIPRVQVDRISDLSPTVILYGSFEDDLHSRFATETWSMTWKSTSFGYSISQLETMEIVLSGNGSSSVLTTSIDHQKWGSILEIDFNGSTETGYYELDIQFGESNILTYSFQVTQSSLGSVLFDNRPSTNGNGHSYGEFFNLETIYRQLGYEVSHGILDMDIDLDNFNMVIAPRFGLQQIHEQLTISKQIPENILLEYDEYMDNGGKLVILAGMPSVHDDEAINNFILPYGLNYTGNEIGDFNSPVITSNFTASEYFDGVVSISIFGGEIQAVSNNVTILGSTIDVTVTPLGNFVFYRGIGGYVDVGLGQLIVFGGSDLIANKYLLGTPGNREDRLFTNLLLLA